MTNYYVSPNGSNFNDGKSSSNPFEKLNFASSILKAGDTLHVGSGVYDTPIYLTNNGTSNNYIKILGDNNADISMQNADKAYDINSHCYILIDNVNIINSSATFHLSGLSTHHINIQNLEIDNFWNSPGISSGSHNLNFTNLDIHRAQQTSSGSANVVNIFGGGKDPLDISNSEITKDITFTNCKLHDGYHNGFNFGPGTGGGWKDWYGKYVMDRITIKNCEVYDITQMAIGCNYVTINHLDLTNTKVYNSRDGIRVTCIDSNISNNEVYGIYFSHPIALEKYNGKNKNNTISYNYVHDCTDKARGYYAIEIGKNDGGNVVINNTQNKQEGDVKFYGGSDNVIIDYPDNSKVMLYNGGKIYFKYSDGRNFSVSGGKTGSLYHEGIYSVIKGESSSTITWTINTSSPVPTPTIYPTPIITPSPTPGSCPDPIAEFTYAPFIPKPFELISVDGSTSYPGLNEYIKMYTWYVDNVRKSQGKQAKFSIGSTGWHDLKLVIQNDCNNEDSKTKSIEVKEDGYPINFISNPTNATVRLL